MRQTLSSHITPTQCICRLVREKNIEPFPLTSGGVREYIEAMAMNYSYASIRRRLSCSETHQQTSWAPRPDTNRRNLPHDPPPEAL